MSDNIPLDIQAEIIKSLPVESLIRFRLVSKRWKSLIGSSKFIADYQKHKRHHHLLVRLKSSHNFDEKYVSIVDDDTFPQHKFSLTVPPSVKLLEKPDIVSSQGLLFVHSYDPVISGTLEALIWNPIIRKSVHIDVCCEPRPDFLTLTFGVGPDTCDPKIVKFMYYQNWGTFYEVAIDRFMYWFAWEASYVGDRLRYKRNLIVSFDMKSEEFTEIKLPDSLEADSARDFNLYNIRESLVMVQHKEAYVYSVWKMMEHGVAKSFTKLYTINPTDDVILDMYGFRTSGEPIVETKNNPQRDLFAYDPDSKHMTYIGIPGSTRDFYPTVYSYTETLLLLDH
ncbi:F-box/kelch-repeat protein-like protein [Tanacetum coccineum]